MKAEAKTYFSKVPGSHFTFPDGFQIYFQHGRYHFKPEEHPGDFFSANEKHPSNGKSKADVYFEELEYLVNSGNPLVFQQGTNPVEAKLPDILDPSKNAKSEADVQRQDADLIATGRAVMTGDANNGVAGTVSDPNVSTVDKDLQATLFKTKTTGPGASKLEEIRAAAAARQQAGQTQAVQNKNGMG